MPAHRPPFERRLFAVGLAGAAVAAGLTRVDLFTAAAALAVTAAFVAGELAARWPRAAELRRCATDLTVLQRVGVCCSEASTADGAIAGVTAAISETLFPDNCGVLLLDPAAGVLRHHPSFVTGGPQAQVIDIPVGHGVTGTVAATGVSRVVRDTAAVPDYIRCDAGMRAELCVPVRAGGLVVGVIDAESRAVGAFSERDGRLLLTVSHVLGNTLDRLRAAEALRQSESLFRLVWGRSADAMRLTERTGVVRMANEAYCRLVGRAAADVVGRPMSDAYTPARRDEVLRKHCERFDTGDFKDFRDAEVELWDGRQRHFDVTNTFLDAPGEEPLLLSVFRDVTERKRLEARLVQSERMEAVGRLAGGVAHDFNNLLTVVNGFAELALGGAPPGHPLRPALEEIYRAGGRAADITRQLLAYGRKQILRPAILDLNALVSDVEPALHALLGERIELVTDLHSGAGRVRVDPGQLREVILHLAANGRDAMPGGGRLTVRTHAGELADLPADPAWPQRAGPCVLLSVSDTGVGMDEATRARAFEPFFTTKEFGKGAGLGLAQVHGIVSQSGGRIVLESEPGSGTTLTIALPRVAAEAAGGCDGQDGTGLRGRHPEAVT